ncbi:MAG: hypothetical protein AAB227_08960, partial [Pseudomonadota bacterium]
TLIERKVTLASADKDTITLAGGVKDGERVVTSPLRGAKGGDKVAPTETTDIPGAARADEDERAAVDGAVREGALR